MAVVLVVRAHLARPATIMIIVTTMVQVGILGRAGILAAQAMISAAQVMTRAADLIIAMIIKR